MSGPVVDLAARRTARQVATDADLYAAAAMTAGARADGARDWAACPAAAVAEVMYCAAYARGVLRAAGVEGAVLPAGSFDQLVDALVRSGR